MDDDEVVGGFRVRLIDTCGLEDPEAGDTVNYAVSTMILMQPCNKLHSTAVQNGTHRSSCLFYCGYQVAAWVQQCCGLDKCTNTDTYPPAGVPVDHIVTCASQRNTLSCICTLPGTATDSRRYPWCPYRCRAVCGSARLVPSRTS